MPASSFRVLTFNTLWPRARRRLRAVGPILDQSGIDVICMQEVALGRNATLLQHSLASYPSMAARRFGIWCVGGLVTFSRHQIIDVSFEVFTRRGEWLSIGAADRLLRKGFLKTRMLIDELPVTVINTHLLANYEEDWSPGNSYVRHQQTELEQLSRAAQEVDASSMLIVTGDFNVPGDHDLFTTFAAGSNLLNSRRGAAPATLRGREYAIDHVLYRAPAGRRVEASAQVTLAEPIDLGGSTKGFASDHLGVCATFDVI